MVERLLASSLGVTDMSTKVPHLDNGFTYNEVKLAFLFQSDIFIGRLDMLSPSIQIEPSFVSSEIPLISD